MTPLRRANQRTAAASWAAVFDLLRWRTTVVAGLATCASGGALHPTGPTLVAALVVMCLCGAAFALNDWFDHAIDAVAAPMRPLPSGRLSRSDAILVAAVFFLLGNVVAFTQAPRLFPLALILTGLAVAYSITLKRHLLVGNIVSALMCSSVFVAGALATSHGQVPTAAPLLTFGFILAREVILDVAHAPGDVQYGRRSLASVYSPRVALLLARLTLVVTALAALVFGATDRPPNIASVTSGVLLSPLIALIPTHPDSRLLRRALRTSGIVMLLGALIWFSA